MPYYRTRDVVSMDYPVDSSGDPITRANGGFTKNDSEVIGRWVEKHETTGQAYLVDENHLPIGVIVRLSETKVAVALGPFVQGKQGGTTALVQNLGITGDTKQIRAGVTERGFVKNRNVSSVTADQAANSRGVVWDSAATTINTEGEPSTQVLMY